MIDFSFAHRSSERRTNFHHLLLDCYKDLDKYFYFTFLFASLANCFPFLYNSYAFSFLLFLISPSTICISLSLQLLSLKMSLLFPPPSSIFFLFVLMKTNPIFSSSLHCLLLFNLAF